MPDTLPDTNRKATILELWSEIHKGNRTGEIATVEDVLEFLATSIGGNGEIPKSFDC